MPEVSPEEAQSRTKGRMDWIGGIAAQNKLVDRANCLTKTGKVVRPKSVVTYGPFTEIKETILGYSIVKADTYEDAVERAMNCPVLYGGGNVEGREVDPL